MTSHEGWRSIISDTCELSDLKSCGDDVKGMKFPLLDSIRWPQHENPESHRLKGGAHDPKASKASSQTLPGMWT